MTKTSKGIFLLLIIVSGFSFAQNTVSKDSLEQLITAAEGENRIDLLNQLAESYDDTSGGRFKIAGEALGLSEKFSYTKGKINAYGNLGRYYYAQKYYDTAFVYYNKAYTLSKIADDKFNIARYTQRLGYVKFRNNQMDSSVILMKEAIRLRSELGNIEALSFANLNLGFIYWRASKYDSALIYYDNALKLIEKRGDKRQIGMLLNNIGILYWNWAVYDKALEYYHRSLKLREEIGDTNGVALVLNNIGRVYRQWKDYKKAYIYFDRALKLSVNRENTDGQAYAYNHLASVYELTENYDSALVYYRKSLSLYGALESLSGVALNYEDIGEVFNLKNMPDSAMTNFQIALTVARKIGNKEQEGTALMNIGKTFFFTGQQEKALAKYFESLEIGKSIRQRELVKDNYLYISNLYADTGQFELSLNFHKMYSEVKDSIFSENIANRVMEYSAKYEITKKEAELRTAEYKISKQKFFRNIAIIVIISLVIVIIMFFRSNRQKRKSNLLLLEKNRRISEQHSEIVGKNKKIEENSAKLSKAYEKLNNSNFQLKELHATKDRFFSIFAHDLKNPFSYILNSTELLEKDYDVIPDADKKDILAHLHTSAQNIYTLLENLLYWSQLQTGRLTPEAEVISLSKLADETISTMSFSCNQKGIKLKNLVGQNLGTIADRFMVATIFRNLLSNAIKFTEPGGEITLSSELNNSAVTVHFEDNGIGIDEDGLKSIFDLAANQRKAGTMNESGSGLGLILCREFALMNEAELTVKSKPGAGSVFSVTFKLSDTKGE